jgi:outer membrane lipoprotein-sorting protein
MLLRGFLLLAVVVAPAAGCAVGGQYGYDPAVAPLQKQYAEAATFEDRVSNFLHRKYSHCGTGNLDIRRRGGPNDDIANFEIRGMKGCVVDGGSEWELIEVTFTKLVDRREVSVDAEGWVASGAFYPSRIQFTKSMEQECPVDLRNYKEQLAVEFTNDRS